MKVSAIVAIQAALLGVSSAAAVEIRGKTCTATWTGSNSEGGGGPGQAPINNNAWGIDVTGIKKVHQTLKQTGKNGVIDQHIGDGYNIDTHAQWNYGGNSWYRCSLKKDGKEHQGKVAKQHISTGTVSVTTDKCTVTFPC
ncbi:hypothetical protein VHEMI04256 [[Torrubiella] hemipterigena]|uniref:Uncharacterized protein n=1 Tax=[Torrubiella] hemipterigena TaxID=1531966 RepID=A0A0A1TDA5_9HYPO|nr:hypothetical protein VHEMI04256 [[Torrubiella] hemipterigena]